MVLNQKGDVAICYRSVAIGRALAETFYVSDQDGIDAPVNQNYIRSFLSMAVGRFLLDYKTEHSFKEIAGYDEFLVGKIVAFESEAGTSRVLLGYDIMLASVLLAIFLKNCMRDKKILSCYAGDLHHFRYPYDADDLERVAYSALIDGRNDAKEVLPDHARFFFERYKDVEDSFPAIFDQATLANFACWFLKKVKFEEVTAYSAYGKQLLAAALSEASCLAA